MADNTTLNAGSGGDVIASDDVGGVKYQVVKLDVGADGAAAPVSNSNPVPVSDAGGTLTVDNAGLTELAAAINASSQVDVNIAASNATVAVSNAGLTELAAAINASSQMDVNIAASNASVAVTNAGITTIAGAVSGTEMQVDVLTMPNVTVVGAAAEDAAASGNPVLIGGRYDSSARTLETGDVGALAVNASSQLLVEIAAGAGSGGTAAADDADFTAGTTSGTPIQGAYQSSPTNVTDGDLGIVGITQTRALRVHVESITGSQTDDAAFTPGTSTVSVIGAEFDDTTPDSVDEGDGGALRMSANRNLYTTLRDAAGNERGANVNASNALLTAQTGALPAGTNNIGDVDILTIAAGDNNIGNVDIVTVPADPFGANADAASATGSISAKLRFIASTGIPITGTVTVGSHAVTNAGTFAVQNTAQASTNTQEMVGDAADDAATAGNPVLVGGVAVETDGTDPTTVSAEGDAAYLRTDRARRLLVSNVHPRGFFTSADYASAQTNASVQAAPGAGLSLYITDIVISNGATAGNITLLDGSGGTVKFEIYPAINGGCTISLRQPIRLTANTALCITSTTVTTHSVNVGGYIAP